MGVIGQIKSQLKVKLKEAPKCEQNLKFKKT